MTLLVRDDFASNRRPGRVLGRARDGDPARGGLDRERLLSIDGGALRIRPALVEGWERTCLAYGPFPNVPGLAFSVFILNGHNTSQSEVMSDTLRSRLGRWARGSGAAPVGRRLRRWLVSGRVRRVLRQIRWWRRIAVGSTRVTPMNENLAIGFFPAAVCDPLRTGTGFVMHADGPRNGELWTGAAGIWSPAVLGVQNVPIHYVLIVRERDVLLAASSLPGAHGLGPHPAMRPLAIVPRPDTAELHAAVHQSLLGQIGFRADTRVFGTRVVQLEAAGGSLCDPIEGDVDLVGVSFPGRRSRFGGNWLRSQGSWLLRPAVPVGLIRIILDPVALGPAGVSIALRPDQAEGRLELRVRGDGAGLWRVEPGGERLMADEAGTVPPTDWQILDDGREISVLAGGRLVFGRRFEVTGSGADTAFGVVGEGDLAPAGLCAIEGYPLAVRLPEELVAGEPWQPAPGVTVVADPLTGEPGDLGGRTTPQGNRCWQRIHGTGCLEVTGGSGARWRASVDEPLPERTIYAVDWSDPDFAELEVTLTPPGSARGQREHGTAGFCVWQDQDNYLLINTWLDDCYGGASLSSFFCIGGFEDIYDAIWTNVGARIFWGRPVRLRLVSDGLRYTVSLDGEPVLYRSLADVYPGCRPLQVKQIGLLGNWEWGADTGSRFADFRAAIRAKSAE